MTEVNLDELTANTSVETADPQLTINMPNGKLPVGQHRFALKVQDDSGNQSAAAQITVIVVDSTAPTAVLDLLDSRGRAVANGRIEFGAGFILSGRRSVDQAGAITKYIWEIVPN